MSLNFYINYGRYAHALDAGEVGRVFAVDGDESLDAELVAVEVALDLDDSLSLVDQLLRAGYLGRADVAAAAKGDDRHDFGSVVGAGAVLGHEGVDEVVERRGKFVDQEADAADFEDVAKTKGLDGGSGRQHQADGKKTGNNAFFHDDHLYFYIF